MQESFHRTQTLLSNLSVERHNVHLPNRWLMRRIAQETPASATLSENRLRWTNRITYANPTPECSNNISLSMVC